MDPFAEGGGLGECAARHLGWQRGEILQTKMQTMQHCTGTGTPFAGRRPSLGTGVPAEGRHWPALGTGVPAEGRHWPALGTGVPGRRPTRRCPFGIVCILAQNVRADLRKEVVDEVAHDDSWERDGGTKWLVRLAMSVIKAWAVSHVLRSIYTHTV